MSHPAFYWFGTAGTGKLGRLGAERNYLGPPPRRVRGARGPSRVSRRWYRAGPPALSYMGLGPGAVGFPQRPFRPRRFIVPSGSVAPGTPVQLFIGNVPLGQGPIPAEVLSEVARGVGINAPWVYPGTEIRMVGAPSGVVFG